MLRSGPTTTIYETHFLNKTRHLRNGKKRNQVSGCGDGTVIVTGNISGDNKRFCDLGYELAEHLKKELDYIFDDDFERKFPTLWSTLRIF